MSEVSPTRDSKGYLQPAQVASLIDAATKLRDLLMVRILCRTFWLFVTPQLDGLFKRRS